MSCLYILEINPLSVVSFVIIFSHPEGYLFTLLIISFAVQNLLSSIRPHLFTFVFIFITLGGRSKRISLLFMSSSLLPMFSSKSFIVSGLTFRSLIHFEFNIVYGVRKWQSTPVFLPGKSHGLRILVGYSPWGREESDTTEQLHFHFTMVLGNVLIYAIDNLTGIKLNL